MIDWKSTDALVEWRDIHPITKELIQDCAEFIWQKFGITLIITDIYRNDKTTHNSPPPYRFVDFRGKDWTDSQREDLLRHINAKWVYDPTDRNAADLDCLIYHDVGRGAHFHAQVRPQTEKRVA